MREAREAQPEELLADPHADGGPVSADPSTEQLDAGHALILLCTVSY